MRLTPSREPLPNRIATLPWAPGWSICTTNCGTDCLYLFCGSFRGAYSPQAPLAFGVALEAMPYDGIAPPSTAALNATYSE